VPYKNQSNVRRLLQMPCNYPASMQIDVGIV
jgi:hypothetical protein